MYVLFSNKNRMHFSDKNHLAENVLNNTLWPDVITDIFCVALLFFKRLFIKVFLNGVTYHTY